MHVKFLRTLPIPSTILILNPNKLEYIDNHAIFLNLPIYFFIILLSQIVTLLMIKSLIFQLFTLRDTLKSKIVIIKLAT